MGLEYYILKEYRRQGKLMEYRGLKKQIVETLRANRWHGLARNILREDGEYVAEEMETDSTGLAIEMQLDEFTTSNDSKESRAEKLK